jgi:SAM-dependent methyltransferase
MKNYRAKIYKHYSSNGSKNLIPIAIDGFKSRGPFFQDIIDNHFPKDKRIKILEVGCGYGAFGYLIQKNEYKSYLGVDGSQEQVEGAKRLGVSNIILMNLVDSLKSTKNDSLDLLIAIDVIEHFSKEELSDLIDEFYRVLKKGGKIITHQPNGSSPFGGSIRYGDFTHELAFTENSISQIFLSSGFVDVSSFEDKPITHGFKSYIRLFLWIFLVKPLYKSLLIIESGGVDKNIVLTKNFVTIVRK